MGERAIRLVLSQYPAAARVRTATEAFDAPSGQSTEDGLDLGWRTPGKPAWVIEQCLDIQQVESTSPLGRRLKSAGATTFAAYRTARLGVAVTSTATGGRARIAPAATRLATAKQETMPNSRRKSPAPESRVRMAARIAVPVTEPT